MYSCEQYSDSCVQRSIRFDKSWKMDYFLIQTKSGSPNKLVHQMATHLSYPHANCGRGFQTIAPRFGGRHKTHYWISETYFENTIIVKQNDKTYIY